MNHRKMLLNNFALRTDLNLLHIVVSGFLVFALGALTVGVKSYQAATVNPVKTLKEGVREVETEVERRGRHSFY